MSDDEERENELEEHDEPLRPGTIELEDGVGPAMRMTKTTTTTRMTSRNPTAASWTRRPSLEYLFSPLNASHFGNQLQWRAETAAARPRGRRAVGAARCARGSTRPRELWGT